MMDPKTDFSTFCHSGDAHRLLQPGQFARQWASNNYNFNKLILVFQRHPLDFSIKLESFPIPPLVILQSDIDYRLMELGIDISKPQYESPDKAHNWRFHVINHLAAVNASQSDYMVFADNDCWMVSQPANQSWVARGIQLLQQDPKIFIVSPNDGEPERMTMRFSQQIFLARTAEFRHADFNQPGWDGKTDFPGAPMPEYWGMLEGRMELYCRHSGQSRYVLGPEYRYWHHNKLTTEGLFQTDLTKY